MIVSQYNNRKQWYFENIISKNYENRNIISVCQLRPHFTLKHYLISYILWRCLRKKFTSIISSSDIKHNKPICYEALSLKTFLKLGPLCMTFFFLTNNGSIMSYRVIMLDFLRIHDLRAGTCLFLHWYLTRFTFFQEAINLCKFTFLVTPKALQSYIFFVVLDIAYSIIHAPLSLEDPLLWKVNDGTFLHMVYITLLVVHADKLL